jgi:tRNA nucleotidyltransferase (CCA-adding enzyme)
MALRLSHPAGDLIDPHGGREDLNGRLIRVLHEASFQDDATRMLRAVRYAQRLGFGLEDLTQAWLQRDLAYCDTVSGARLRAELERLFEEEGQVGIDGVLLARDLGLLRALHSALDIVDNVAARWREALTQLPQVARDEAGFCLLLTRIDQGTAESVASRLHLTGRQQRTLRDFVWLRQQSNALAASSLPSEAVRTLEGRSLAAVWALAVALGGAVGEKCWLYLTRWRGLRPHLRGDDLIAMGLQPGPDLGALLAALARARLDGELTTREDEIEFVRSLQSDNREAGEPG